ncbi:Aste57867_24740 [Aphanomyces stellatus]|uniref:Aste57867_24740 protein n=1 Tax=Aphanomyces stellatus TaxID=120398 RepID=A0A485LRB5_9STRA|nr:hypothetical protein As57867_024662 [Aphanomyces stellatus]VFU01376.1 Aste57867_24740 [Aphanomyces stellatus]
MFMTSVASAATCAWGTQNKYDYNITTLSSSSETGISMCFGNVFNVNQPLAYPYPFTTLQCHIQLTLVTDVSANGVNRTNTYLYDSQSFVIGTPATLYNLIPHSAGIYRYQLTGYANTPQESTATTCTACLSVTDTFRPFGTTSADCYDSFVDGFTQANIASFLPQVNDTVTFRQKAKNNACSDARCDSIKLIRTSFFGAVIDTSVGDATALTDVPAGWTTCFNAPAVNSEWTILTTSVFDPDTGEPQAYDCARSCEYNLQLKELFTPYACANTYVANSRSRKTCTGDVNQACHYVQSIAATGDDLVAAVAVRLKPSTLFLPNPSAVFPSHGGYQAPSDASRELHFDARCDANNPDFSTFCNLQLQLSDLFQFSATLNTDPAITTLLQARTTTAAPIVFWRFQVNGGVWRPITNASVLSFPQFKSNVIFEAWTACGQVGSAILWTVYAHRTNVLALNDWWHGLWACGDGTCNVPHTDFRVCSFKFDPTTPAYQTMLNPETATSYAPTDANGTPVATCAVIGPSGTQTCMSGCWFNFTICDTGVTQAACADRTLQDGNRFVWCDASGAFVSPPVEDTTALLAATELLSTELFVKWSFAGFQCTWQYANTRACPTLWLNTTAAGTAQPRLVRDVALKMQNAPLTDVTVTCTFAFQSRNPVVPLATHTRTKMVRIRNCDVPVWNAAHPTDHGAYVADTCAVGAWTSNLSLRQPAPFQACAGDLVFPDIATTVYGTMATTIVATVDIQTHALACCNNGTAKPFTCQALGNHSTIGVCSDSTTPGIYYEGGSLSMVKVGSGLDATALVIVVVAVVGLVVAMTMQHRGTIAAVEDYRMPLLD